jgi:ABC-type glycerol-3-phosphate transport system permease component
MDSSLIFTVFNKIAVLLASFAIASVSILIIFIAFQRFFFLDIAAGGVKG